MIRAKAQRIRDPPRGPRHGNVQSRIVTQCPANKGRATATYRAGGTPERNEFANGTQPGRQTSATARPCRINLHCPRQDDYHRSRVVWLIVDTERGRACWIPVGQAVCRDTGQGRSGKGGEYTDVSDIVFVPGCFRVHRQYGKGHILTVSPRTNAPPQSFGFYPGLLKRPKYLLIIVC